MPDYPVDMKIDQNDLNVFLNADGDMATIGGKRNLEQSVAIIVRDQTQQFIGDRITGSSVGLLEERVRQALNNDPQVDEIVNAEIREFDRGEDKITLEFETTENETFTLPVAT